VSQPDFCFRSGGDEFALILSCTPADETEPIAARLYAEIGAGCMRPEKTPVQIRFAVAQLRNGDVASRADRDGGSGPYCGQARRDPLTRRSGAQRSITLPSASGRGSDDSISASTTIR
jgi:hypothetical protein